MTAADLDAVAELFRNAGDEALHDRFFTLGDRVVTEHLADLGGPTQPRCQVAVLAGRVVGIVELAKEPADSEEVALLVATGLHHRGIGTSLLAAAMADARQRGVATLVADVLATNHLMIEVFADAGATLARRDGDVRVTLPVSRVAVHRDE